MSVTFNDKYLSKFVSEDEYIGITDQVYAAHALLHEKKGLGNEFTGWVELPTEYDKAEFSRIKEAAAKICSDSEIFVVIGIGGSYLGARAAIEFLKSPFYNEFNEGCPKIYFAGNDINSDALSNLLALCEDRDFSVNMISKSGTTTEPAIAFRVFRELLEKKYGKEGAKSRIYCTTDKESGALKCLADAQGYETFVVPDNIGGRYSVLTAVGLLPIAVSGADIDALMTGAQAAAIKYLEPDFEINDCYRYAALRNILYKKGYSVELFVSYENRLLMLAEWFKQLFGESEGKNQKGIFPASVSFSTDLHSMGQYIQDGKRFLFESVLLIENPKNEILLKEEPEDIDGLNFLAGKSMSYINRKAFEGTLLAHMDGGVPNIIMSIPQANEFELGGLFYFYEKACAVSGYILGVNPFNQPGVESYKKNMFALLGKPGYEKETKNLTARLGN